MKHAISRELYQYWDRLRRGQPAPQRSDIEPSDIRRVLADTFIVEITDHERYTIRLAGTRICAAYGREIRGEDFLALWSGDDRQAVTTLAAAVAQDAAAAVLTLEWATARGPTVTAELLLLPLRHGGTGYQRILGSFAPFERPYWLGSEPVVRQSIASLRLIWPDEHGHFMRRTSDRVETSAPIPFPIENRRRRGHLFVVDGGKD